MKQLIALALEAMEGVRIRDTMVSMSLNGEIDITFTISTGGVNIEMQTETISGISRTYVKNVTAQSTTARIPNLIHSLSRVQILENLDANDLHKFLKALSKKENVATLPINEVFRNSRKRTQV